MELMIAVETAISKAVLKHPILQVGIRDVDFRRPCWVQLESLDLQHHIKWQFLDLTKDFNIAFHELTTSQLDMRFTEIEHRPGWVIAILHQEQTDFFELLFTWNHAHFDGMGGKIFQEDLLQSLNSQTQDKVRNKLCGQTLMLPKTPPTLPPPIEQACKLPITIGFALKTLWEEFKPASLWWSSSLARWAPCRVSPYKTQSRSFSVDHDALGKILAACRQHQTTLTGLLQALVFVSLARQLNDTISPAFQSATLVNLRRYLPAALPGYPDFRPERTMANYVTYKGHKYDTRLTRKIRSKLPPATASGEGTLLSKAVLTDMWSVATRVRREVKRKVDSRGLKDDIVGLMRFVGDWRQQMSHAASRPRQFSWWVSNIGVIDGRPPPGVKPGQEESAESDRHQSTKETWSIRAAQFALPGEVPGGAILISPVSVAGQGLWIGLSWQDCVMDVALGERLQDDLARWMDQIASETSSPLDK